MVWNLGIDQIWGPCKPELLTAHVPATWAGGWRFGGVVKQEGHPTGGQPIPGKCRTMLLLASWAAIQFFSVPSPMPPGGNLPSPTGTSHFPQVIPHSVSSAAETSVIPMDVQKVLDPPLPWETTT